MAFIKVKNKSCALLKVYGLKKQVRFDWCRFSQTNNIMPFDFGVDIIQKEMEELKNETSCVFISCEDVYQSHIVALTGDIKYKKMIIEKKLDVLEKAKKSQKELKNAK